METQQRENFLKLLGDDFSEAELETLLQENPSLGEDAESFLQAYQALKTEPLPMMNPHFTTQVMQNLHPAKKSKTKAILFWAFGGLTVSAALTVFLILGVHFLLRSKHSPLQPGIQIATLKPNDPAAEKNYEVRFTLPALEATTVELMGDFSGWQKIALQKTPEGHFTLKLKLSAGTYAYGFYIDGKTWIVDPAAKENIQDGFGSYNSVIQL